MGIISTTKAIQAVRAGWLLLLEIRESNEVDMGKRILLISNYFAPDNTIAAVRTTKIAKYLIQNGYYVEVIKEKQDSLAIDESLREDSKNIKISYAINSKQYKRIKKFYDKLFGAIRIKRLNNLDNRIRINPRTGKREFYPYETAYPLLGSLDYIMEQMKQFDLFRSIKRELREKESFDYILTSYGDSFCFFAGKYYHKYHRNTKWIFDIRDAIYRYKFVPDYIKFIPQLYEKYVWKNSDCIIGVSKAICKRVPAKYRYRLLCQTLPQDEFLRAHNLFRPLLRTPFRLPHRLQCPRRRRAVPKSTDMHSRCLLQPHGADIPTLHPHSHRSRGRKPSYAQAPP